VLVLIGSVGSNAYWNGRGNGSAIRGVWDRTTARMRGRWRGTDRAGQVMDMGMDTAMDSRMRRRVGSSLRIRAPGRHLLRQRTRAPLQAQHTSTTNSSNPRRSHPVFAPSTPTNRRHRHHHTTSLPRAKAITVLQALRRVLLRNSVLRALGLVVVRCPHLRGRASSRCIRSRRRRLFRLGERRGAGRGGAGGCSAVAAKRTSRAFVGLRMMRIGITLDLNVRRSRRC
jgi:hypothetical protein